MSIRRTLLLKVRKRNIYIIIRCMYIILSDIVLSLYITGLFVSNNHFYLTNVVFSYQQNGFRIYVDKWTGENLMSIQLAIVDLIYWSVRSFSRRKGDGVKGIVILANFEHHFIIAHPSNHKFIINSAINFLRGLLKLLSIKSKAK